VLSWPTNIQARNDSDDLCSHWLWSLAFGLWPLVFGLWSLPFDLWPLALEVRNNW